MFNTEPPGTEKLKVSPAAMLNWLLPQTSTERSETERTAVPAPFTPDVANVAEPFVTVYDPVVGRAAHTGLGSMATGPTANIAVNNLRSDNLTGGAFFI